MNIDDCTKRGKHLFYFIVRLFYLNGSEFVKINDERGLFSYLSYSMLDVCTVTVSCVSPSVCLSGISANVNAAVINLPCSIVAMYTLTR